MKGKIERTIGFAKGNFFNGRTFTNINDINNQCMEWLKIVNGKTHATTGKIPFEMLKDEILIPIDSAPEFVYSIAQSRRVSKECYVHYNSNRYSVPWKYAGRECVVREENGKIRITIDDEIIEHDVLHGSGMISRKKEHFEGLMKAVKDTNKKNYGIEVEKRDLHEYEEGS